MQEASINLWYEALGTPLGIVVATSDPERFRQKMYAIRKDSGDKSLDEISIAISPTSPSNQVWLVKRKSSET